MIMNCDTRGILKEVVVFVPIHIPASPGGIE